MLKDPIEIIIKEAAAFTREKMKNLRASHGWDHVQRVYALSERIARAEGADIALVRLAALLHDIAREEEDRSGGGICHAEKGSLQAREFLMGRGLDGDRADQVAHCIITHRFRNNHVPQTPEARALYDADKLDSIGAIGIGRAFLFSGEVGAKLHNPDAEIEKTSAYSEEDTAYREFAVKLRFVKDRMLTDEGRRIAEERHEFMLLFFHQLDEEVRGLR